MILEPVEEFHAPELWNLFQDPELHHFLPFEPRTLEQQADRCRRWAKRRSPDGDEIWLNWAARERSTRQVIAHFQAGVKQNSIASIGYLVARSHQNRGIATEGLEAVFTYLRDEMKVKEVKAWADTRNLASHRLARKLGMEQVELIPDADYFKGTCSDEFVFSKVFTQESAKASS